MAKKTESPLGDCNKAAGSLPAGNLLYRACWWHEWMTVERGGKLWIVKSRDEWMNETGLTLKQYTEALKTLKQGLFVETKQGHWAGKNVTFLRLLPRGIALASGEPYAPEGTPEYALEGTLHIHGDTLHGESYSSSKTKPPIVPHDGKDGEGSKDSPPGELSTPQSPPPFTTEQPVEEEVHPEYTGDSKEAVNVKAHELAAMGGKLPKASAKKEALSLAYVWRDAYVEKHPGFFAALTGVQVAQLKKIANACPSHKAPEIVRLVIDQWSAFTSHVKLIAGVYTVPAVPNIGFVLKHVQVAIQFWEKKGAHTPNMIPKVSAPLPTASTPVTEAYKGPQKLSLEEVQALLAEDGEGDD